MKIIHPITRFLNAGAEENTAINCNGQVGLGYEVTLLHGPDSSKDTFKRLLGDGVIRQKSPNLIRSPHPIKDVMCLWEMYKYFKKVKPDVVHTHTSKAGILGRIAAKFAGVPYIFHTVHILPFVNVSKPVALFYITLEKICARYTNAFINVSSGMLEQNLKQNIGRKDNHFVVASGMDIDVFRKGRKPRWQDLIPEDEIAPELREKKIKFIICVGAFEGRKRQLDLIRQFNKTSEKCSDAVLILLGDGDERARAEALVRELGLEGRVVFPGFRKNAAEYIKLAYLGVLISEREGLARVIIQYILAGLPIVVTNNPGVDIYAKEGNNAFLVPVDDISLTHEKMTKILQDDNLHKKMEKASKETNLEHYGKEHMVAEIEKIYQKYMAK